MSRTNIDIDDELVNTAMRRYGLHSKRAAVDLALRRLVGDAMTREEALEMEGSGWDGDLEELRTRGGGRSVTLIDTSAWVEFLRRTGTETHDSVRTLLEHEDQVWTTDVVAMELLAGARDADHHQRLRRLLARCHYVSTGGLATYEAAADLYRRCRRAGETVRALSDCLIAAVALRAQLSVLHNDHDFDVLGRRVGLVARRGTSDQPSS